MARRASSARAAAAHAMVVAVFAVSGLVGTARAQPAPVPPAAEPAAPPATTPAGPAPVKVEVRIVPAAGRVAGDVKLAEPQVLELTAVAPSDATLYPPFRPALGGFQVVDTLPGTKTNAGATKTEVWRYRVVPLRLGVEKIPALEIPYKLADGTGGQVMTPLVRVRVVGFLENEQDPSPGALPEPVPVIATNWALIWALSVGGALVLAALATFFTLKALENRFKALMPAPPPRPANEVALERLDVLDRTPPTELAGAARLAATIDTLRVYLQGRYGVDAPEMTTRELVKALDEVDLKSVTVPEIATLLEDTDLVKFARLTPSDEDARATSPTVRRIVVETWEPPKVEFEEIERLDPASLKQRVYAGGLDVALALGLGAVLVGLLFVLGASMALLGLIIPLVGLVLTLRDVFGRSPGKMVLGTALVQRNERQPAATLGQRLKRNSLFLLWPVTLPLEALVLRKHPLGLRLGDLWADTEVVLGGARRVVQVARPAAAASSAAKAGGASGGATGSAGGAA